MKISTSDKVLISEKLNQCIYSFDTRQSILVDTRQSYLDKEEIMRIITKAFQLPYHSDFETWNPESYPYLGNSYTLPYGHLSGFSHNIDKEDYPQMISFAKIIESVIRIEAKKLKKIFMPLSSLNEI